MNNDTELLIFDFYARPCVNGNSSTGEHFRLYRSNHTCDGENYLGCQPKTSFLSPILLSLAGISGQIAALIYLHRSSRPGRRTTFYVMLSTLIWTDLIGKFITTPQPLLAYSNGHWVGGEIACKLHGYSMSLICLVTHLLVASMAVERYLGIRCGYFYNRNVTIFRTRALLIGIWFFGLLYCSLPLVGVGEFRLHYPGTWCHINQHICADNFLPSRIFSNLYSTINLSCMFIVVLGNLIVVGTLLKMRVTKFRPSNSCRRVSIQKKKPRETEIQMVILLVIITITFLISWAPHDLMMIKNQIWPVPPNKAPLFDIYAVRLASINQIVDPWSYIICRLIFRSKLWGCCRTVIIGRVTSMKFSSSRMDHEESSSIRGISAPRLKFSSLKRFQKRSSLPNPSEIELQTKRRRQENHRCDKHGEPCFENSSSSSVLHHDCKSCFPPNKESTKKTSSLFAAFAKLFQSPSSKMKANRRDEEDVLSDTFSKTQTTVQTVLASCGPKSFLDIPFSRNSEGKREEHISCGNLIFKNDEAQYPLLQDMVIPKAEVLTRSNSWCCTDEYTLAKKKKRTSPGGSCQKMKKRQRCEFAE